MVAQDQQSFKYVYIPADLSAPIQEMELELIPGKEVEGFIDRLKDHFRSGAPAKTAAQIKAQKAELASQLPPGTPIDDNLLSLATSMQMVETISLLYNSRDNGFVGVNMYVDDAGSVRGAERNVRASELAHCCGQPLDVKGDAFLARVMDNGDDFARMDFNLAEMSSSAAWVKAAAQQAAQRRQRDSAESVLRRMQDGGGKKEATATVRELSPAEAAKEEGNAAFKRGDWANAVGHYTQAVEFDPHMLPALNNRAMALLKLERWQEALEDCQTVLGMQPSNVKALLRAAAAEMELGMLPEAKRHLEDAVSAEPNNKEAAQRLAQLSQTL